MQHKNLLFLFYVNILKSWQMVFLYTFVLCMVFVPYVHILDVSVLLQCGKCDIVGDQPSSTDFLKDPKKSEPCAT